MSRSAKGSIVAAIGLAIVGLMITGVIDGLLFKIAGPALCVWGLYLAFPRSVEIHGDSFICLAPLELREELRRATPAEIAELVDGILEYQSKGKSEADTVTALEDAGWSRPLAVWASRAVRRYGHDAVLATEPQV